MNDNPTLECVYFMSSGPGLCYRKWPSLDCRFMVWLAIINLLFWGKNKTFILFLSVDSGDKITLFLLAFPHKSDPGSIPEPHGVNYGILGKIDKVHIYIYMMYDVWCQSPHQSILLCLRVESESSVFQILFWCETTNIFPPCMKITCQANLPLPPSRAHTHTHTHTPRFTPLGCLLTTFLFRPRGGRFEKPYNLGEETAFSCLCPNSNSILQITSHETTTAKAVSIKNLERDGMSGSVEEINRLTPGKIVGLF